jgi:hypothetical protein
VFWSALTGFIATLGTLQALGAFSFLFSPSPVATFHQTADHACARLPEAATRPEGVEIAGAQVGDFTPPLSAHGLITTDEVFSRRIATPVKAIARALFAAPPPPTQYRDEYKRFEQQWVSMAQGLSSLELEIERGLYDLYYLHGEWPERTLPRSHRYGYLKRLIRVLDHDRRIMHEAEQASELASILDVERCVRAITWVENEAENLGTLLLGYPATPVGRFGDPQIAAVR